MKCMLLIGMPGSGKSWWTRNFLKSNPDYVVISSDDIIDEKCAEEGITYSEGFLKFIGFATAEMNRRIKNSVDNGFNIIWDQTNMNVKTRKSKISQLPGYTVEAVVFSVSDPVLKQRLDERARTTGKSIPENVLKSMAQSYVPPSKAEGFEKITFVRG